MTSITKLQYAITAVKKVNPGHEGQIYRVPIHWFQVVARSEQNYPPQSLYEEVQFIAEWTGQDSNKKLEWFLHNAIGE